jgi:hypothetical protein
MDALRKLANNIISINQDEIFLEVFSQKPVKDFIIELNTIEQLFKKGVDANNSDLANEGGDYSDLTIQGVPGLFLGKVQKGLPTNWITLFDSGEFYDSWVVEVDKTSIEIDADTIKADGTDLRVRWGKAILGLNDESLEKLVVFAIPFYQEAIRKAITEC